VLDEGYFMSELAKLRWRCRRGMKELDVLLLAYLERHYGSAPAEEQRIFADLLELQDPQLYSYIIGCEAPSDPAVGVVMSKILGKIRAAAHS
jgi:antitoxin CptB